MGRSSPTHYCFMIVFRNHMIDIRQGDFWLYCISHMGYKHSYYILDLMITENT